MPNYIDPTVTIQLWAANDAVLQGVSAKFTKDSKARLAMTEGTLHLPHFPAHPSTQVVTVYYSDGSRESAENLALLSASSTKGIFKLIGAVTLAELPKDRLMTTYEFLSKGLPGTHVGISYITLSRHQSAVPHVMRGIRELAANSSTEEVINTINQLIKNAREAGLMGRQVVAHVPVDGIDVGGHADGDSGVDVPPAL